MKYCKIVLPTLQNKGSTSSIGIIENQVVQCIGKGSYFKQHNIKLKTTENVALERGLHYAFNSQFTLAPLQGVFIKHTLLIVIVRFVEHKKNL